MVKLSTSYTDPERRMHSVKDRQTDRQTDRRIAANAMLRVGGTYGIQMLYISLTDVLFDCYYHLSSIRDRSVFENFEF